MRKQQKNTMKNFTKAETLQYLEKKLSKSKIEQLMFFSVFDWNNEKNKIINKIIKIFDGHKIIIRSSAIGEDSSQNSEAGNYNSYQNVSLDLNGIKIAVKNVIKSYEKKGNFNNQNQILIQKQTTHVKTSGVVFTRVPENDSSYYIVDFEDSEKTDSVTKGISSNIVKIIRTAKYLQIPIKWKKLINAIKEIELITNNQNLDIEFAITKNHIVIFQVRPLTTNKIDKSSDMKIVNEVKKNIIKYKKLNKKTSSLVGSNTIFSDMTDWNPSEIIGTHPNKLDYSLYNYLIMKDIWHLGRQKIGYAKLKNVPLMTRFGSKPYVDLRASFNSMMPNIFPEKIKNKLIKYYFEKLKKNPELHDKVEFEILFSCFDLTLNKKLKELEKYNFSKHEIQKIKNMLIDFTNRLIKDFPETVIWANKSMQTLSSKRKLDKKYNTNDHKSYVSSIKNLLYDCQKYGTLPFSTLARIAFTSTIILKSLEKQKILSKKEIDNIMNSVETPLTKFQEDLKLLSENQINEKDFLKLYGHLRPGTYDITAKRYDQNKGFYENIKYVNPKNPKNFRLSNKKINLILKNQGLFFEGTDFINFVKKSLELREFLKFEFTKNLSDALELIANLGKLFNLSRKDMSNVSIKTILNLQNKNKTEANKILTKEIQKNKNIQKINEKIILPPILFSKNDFIIISHYFSKPNFITQKKILSDSIMLNNIYQPIQLSGKIIMMENADPGYDWIFSKNPSGLITKYGGVASHMSIRCSELKLPAAIGCGEILYDQFNNATKILLDCKNQQIIVLDKEKEDIFSEEKKILKSLGYIK